MPETRCARIAYRTSRYAEAGSGDPRTQGASTLRPTLFMHMGMRCPPTAVGPQGPSQCRRGSVECAFVSACRRLEGVWARSAAGQPQGRHEVSSHQRRATWKGSWGRRLMDCCRGVATRSEAVLRADLSGARMLNPVGDAREPLAIRLAAAHHPVDPRIAQLLLRLRAHQLATRVDLRGTRLAHRLRHRLARRRHLRRMPEGGLLLRGDTLALVAGAAVDVVPAYAPAAAVVGIVVDAHVVVPVELDLDARVADVHEKVELRNLRFTRRSQTVSDTGSAKRDAFGVHMRTRRRARLHGHMRDSMLACVGARAHVLRSRMCCAPPRPAADTPA